MLTKNALLPASTLMLILAACSSPSSETAPTDIAGPFVQPADFDIIAGEWVGDLTYRNYSPPEQDVTIPAEMTIERTAGGARLSFRFPEEPEQNGRQMMKVTKNFTKVGRETVTGRAENGGTLVINTETECEDLGREALCTFTYVLSSERFELEKIVALKDGTEPFRRNAYRMTRPK